MANSSIDGYAAEADALAIQYESISFAQAHELSMHLMPVRPSTVLDIGAGTGRDAAHLAGLGHSVLAVEPTAELRAHGQRLHPSAHIAWLDDGLPQLAHVVARRQTFDLILLTAVWMHLDPHERQQGMAILASLVAPGGSIVMTLRHGPVPSGRRMFDVGYDETVLLAEPVGLRPIFRAVRQGLFGRTDVHWTILALQLAEATEP
jgi:SAM-dependent methyltransferase